MRFPISGGPESELADGVPYLRVQCDELALLNVHRVAHFRK